jgi:hypothetical protein
LELKRLGQLVEQLHAEGHVIDDATLSQTTPLMRKHLNPFGRYHSTSTECARQFRHPPGANNDGEVDVTLSGSFRADVASTRTSIMRWPSSVGY